MGDAGDVWKGHREWKRDRANQREMRALRQMRRERDRDPQFRFTHDGGYKYLVHYGTRAAAYWPRTGATIFLGPPISATQYLTVAALLQFLKFRAETTARPAP